MLSFRSPDVSMRAVARLVAPLVIALALGLCPLVAQAATYVVDGVTCTLPNAIIAANTDTTVGTCNPSPTPGGADTLILTSLTPYSFNTGPFMHDGANATPSVTSTITIDGGPLGAIVERTNGPDQYRLFHVGSRGNLTLQNVTVRNGDAGQERGGAIHNRGTLALVDSRIVANKAAAGGGIFNGDWLGGETFDDSTVTLTNSDVISNTAKGGGGGIFSLHGSTTSLTNSDLVSNSAGYDGGGIWCEEGTVTLNDSGVVSNTAANDGGGIYNAGGATTLTNSDVISNSAANDGGGLSVSFITTLTDSGVISNTSGNDGGGIYNIGGTTTLTNSDVVSNKSGNDGGGIWTYYGTTTLANSDVVSNTASVNGGGIFNSSTNNATTLRDTDIISNRANFGGGIYSFGDVTLTDTDLVDNFADTSGGGVFQAGGKLSIVSSRLLNNTSAGAGGALAQEHILRSSSNIEQSCIVGNSDTAITNSSDDAVEAPNNWWGAPDGPSGAGMGAGDTISSNVNFAPFLTSAILGCPTRVAEVAFSKSASPSGDLLPGEPLTYRLTITNTGSQNVNGLFVVDNLPAAFLLSETNTSGPPSSFNGVGYVVSAMAPADVATIEFVGRVDDTLTSDQVLSNTATLSHSIAGVFVESISNNVVVPKLNWSASSYDTSEADGIITATVLLSPTNPHATVTAVVVITDSAETDLKPATVQTRTVSFPPNIGSQPVAVVVDDHVVAGPRTILLALESPSGAALGDPSNAAINVLVENDQRGLEVVKSASASEAVVGETITYTYRITNSGNVTLTAFEAVDSRLGVLAGLDGELAPNTPRETTVGYVVQESDLPGPILNTVVVTGTDELGQIITQTATASVNLIGLVVTKSASTTQAMVGETITYTYGITNSGNVMLTAIEAVDDRLGEIVGLSDELAPQQSRSATLTYVAEPDDAAAPLTNMVTVTGTDRLGGIVIESASASVTIVLPVLNWSSENYVAGEDSGTFTATVILSPTNPSATVTVQAVITGSDESTFVAAGIQELVFPPNSNSQPVVVQVPDDAVVAQRVILLGLQNPNNAALGDVDNAVLTLDEDDAMLGLAVSKSASTAQASVGDTITFTYRITNTGTLTLTSISANDDRLGNVAGLVGELAPEQTRSATLTQVVPQGTPLGDLTNTVTVTGTDETGASITSRASASVLIGEQGQREIHLPQITR